MPKQNGQSGHGVHVSTAPETETKTFKTAGAAASWLAKRANYRLRDTCGGDGLTLVSNRIDKAVTIGPCV